MNPRKNKQLYFQQKNSAVPTKWEKEKEKEKKKDRDKRPQVYS